MEGVEDHSIKPPLIVVDGANVAFAYGKAAAAQQQHANLHNNHHAGKPVPDVTGLRVVNQFFGGGGGCRVLVVLTQSWLRQHQDPEQRAILQELQTAGQLVTAPSTDDDDAYALQIAQRENAIRRRQ